MHYREQGRSLQLIRTTYDATRKRGVQTVVGRIPLYTYTVPADVAPLLTPDELAELREYLAALEKGRRSERLSLQLSTLPTTLRDAATALQAGQQVRDAAAVWEALAELQRALKAAGHPKPAAAAKKAPAAKASKPAKEAP